MTSKTQLFSLLLIGLSSFLSAQNGIQNKLPRLENPEKAPYTKVYTLPEQFVPEAVNPNPLQAPAVNYRAAGPEEYIAITRWDAQSYGCMTQRTWENNDGKPVATWIFGTDETGAFPERGTGYSTRVPDTWTNTTARLETIRTGFPAATRLSDGTEIVVAHTTAFTPYRLAVARKAPGASTWTESFLENPVGAGCLWPHIATDGQNVHVIAITTPVANTGTIYQGMDGHVLYWRSTDGGLTWDKKASIISGLESPKFKVISADNYTIDANNGIVAVAVYPDWNDLQIFKSWDNGDNWGTITVNDFPDAIENYAGAAGDSYTFDDIGYYDEDAPDSLAVFSSDGFGSVLVDASGQVHTWFGYMYYIDDDVASGTSYYPGMNGLVYWNEGLNQMSIITGALDYTGDTTLNIGSITEIGPYYNNLASFATVGTDENDVIYLCYAAVNELYRSDWGAEKDQFYRHLYLMKSTDNGLSWGDPYEITKPPYVDEFIVPFAECVWPALPRHIGDEVCLIYQQDATPGTDLWGDNHSTSENGINYLCVDRDSIPPGTTAVSYLDPAGLELNISPNPASQIVRISAVLKGEGQNSRIEIFNMLGHQVANFTLPKAAGRQSITVPVGNLPAGTFTVRVSEGNRQTSGLMVKQ